MKNLLMLAWLWLLLSLSALAQTLEPPVFTGINCPYALPAGVEVTCGELTVPENRDDPENDRQIQIAVAILHATGQNWHSDPILYLAGGPGGYTLQTLENFRTFRSLYRDRDFIVMDQRGVGFSRPALDCPEITVFEEENRASDLAGSDFQGAYQNAVADCRARLLDEGIDLNAYHTDANAADIEALRLALGYDQWNVFGTSYGTSLAQTVIRDYPESVRSVILDSPLTLDSQWVLNSVSLAASAFDRLYAACEDCDDLENTLLELAQQLNAAPVPITVDFFGTPLDILLDGDELLQIVYRALYSPQAIPELPRVVYAAAGGDFQDIGLYEIYDVFESNLYSMGMNLSVLCADVSGQAVPESSDGVVERAFTPQTFLAQCDVWDVPPRPNRNPLGGSAIPALLLVGEFDPVAPRVTAEAIADMLDTVYLYEFPGLSHLVSFSNPCPVQIMVDFMDRPFNEPDTGCLARLPTVG